MLRPLLFLVSAVVLVDVLFFSAIVPLLPHYRDDLGLTKSQTGLLGGAYAAGNLFTAIPTGMLAARLGPRRVLLVGLALMTVACITFGFAKSYELLVIARFAQGIGGACAWAAGMGWLITAAPPERRGEVIGTALGVAVAGALGGPIVGTVAEAVGTGPVFATIGIVAVVLAVLTLRQPAPPQSDATGGLRQAFGNRRVLAGIWLTLLAATFAGVFTVLVPLRLDGLGVGAAGVGAVFLVSAGFEAATSPIVGRTSDRRGPLVPLRLGFAGLLAGTFLIPLAVESWQLIVIVVGVSAFMAMVFSPAMAMLSNGADVAGLPMGLAFGLVNLAWAGGQVLGAAGGAATADATTDGVAYAIVGTLCGLTFVALARKQSLRAAEAAA